ncbi:hypothetical protein DRQ33_05620 [bacterium]|nr:MAG: hypothetical protein DRQ33_05620 [bacterium]
MKKLVHIISVVVALITIAMGWILGSSYFVLRRIEFFGMDTISEQEIVNRLPFRTGDNLLWISTQDAENLLLTNKKIESVEIEKHFPDAISINIVEKKPYYLLNCGEIWGITQNCEAIPIKDFRKLPSLPIVNIEDEYIPKPYYVIHNPAVIRSVNFLNTLSRYRPDFLDNISEIYSPQKDQFEIVMAKTGLTVIMRENPQVLNELDIILNNIGEQIDKAVEIDLRFPNQGIVRYKLDQKKSSQDKG